MSRVTDSEVKALLTTDREVKPFIETASLLVDELLVGQGMSDARLKQVELYLSAHYLAIAEERGALLSSEKGDSKDEYGVAQGQGLTLTRFGQQALALDSSGVLSAEVSPTKKALFRVV